MSTSPERSLDPSTVAHIARLARLELTPETAERLRRDLGAILGHVDRLAGLDTTGVPPTVLAGAGEMPLPPYIHERLADPERYQTVYARQPGSAAAVSTAIVL